MLDSLHRKVIVRPILKADCTIFKLGLFHWNHAEQVFCSAARYQEFSYLFDGLFEVRPNVGVENQVQLNPRPPIPTSY